MNNNQKNKKVIQKKIVRRRRISHQVNFWDLSPNIRVSLNKDFCVKLFDSCNTNLRNLSKTLNISYPYVCHLKRQLYSIPISIIIRLSVMSNISLEKIQKNIITLRARTGRKVNISLPLRPNNDLASLVGHVFGDGYIGNKKSGFEYSNFNPNLIEQVKTQIHNLFKIKPSMDKPERIQYPTVIGEILKSFGAPIAPKIHSNNLVPRWISGSEEYSTEFLRAFFDDDGSVMYSKNYRACGINLYIIRHHNYEKDTLSLLNQIRSMLSQLDIHAGQPIIAKQYDKPDGKRIVAYVNITDTQSIRNFHRKIGMTQGTKSEKLRIIANRNCKPIKHIENKINNRILNTLSLGKASTSEIASKIGISKQKALKKLKWLQKKRQVLAVGKVAINRSYIWKLGGKQM